jgi:hypothetical protein
VPAWEGNESWDGFLAYHWEGQDHQRVLVAVNYAATQGQCFVRLPSADLADRSIRLRDLMGSAHYDRDGNDLRTRGLYLDLQPWAYHVFALEASAPAPSGRATS